MRRALVRPGNSRKRPRDHPAHHMLAHEQLPRDLARPVQLGKGDRVLVRGDLEDRVRRSVYDPLPGALVLLAQLGDDGGPGRRPVSDHAAPGATRELVEQLLRKAVRIGAKRPVEDDPADLPVPRGRVLTLGLGERHPVRGGRTTNPGRHTNPARKRGVPGAGRKPGDRPAPAQAQPLQIREPEAPDRTRDIPERVAARVAVGRRIGRRPDPQAVQHDDGGALQS